MVDVAPRPALTNRKEKLRVPVIQEYVLAHGPAQAGGDNRTEGLEEAL